MDAYYICVSLINWLCIYIRCIHSCVCLSLCVSGDVDACMYLCMAYIYAWICSLIIYIYSLVINEWFLINGYVCMCMLVYVRVGVYAYVSVCTCESLVLIIFICMCWLRASVIQTPFGEIQTQLQKIRTRSGFVSLWTRHRGDLKTDP